MHQRRWIDWVIDSKVVGVLIACLHVRLALEFELWETVRSFSGLFVELLLLAVVSAFGAWVNWHFGFEGMTR